MYGIGLQKFVIFWSTVYFPVMAILDVCFVYSPKFDLPMIDTTAQSRGKMTLTCHRCNEVGHKAIACPRASLSASVSPGNSFRSTAPAAQHSARPYYSGFRHDLRPLDQVTCFKVIVVINKCTLATNMSKCFYRAMLRRVRCCYGKSSVHP